MDESIKIEKGIPLPEETRGRNSKYPWGEMEIGDSFFIKDAEKYSVRYRTVQQCASRYGKLRDKKFKSTSEGSGIRVWRTA